MSEVKKEVFWLGHVKDDENDQACDNCVKQQSILPEIKSKATVPVEEKHGDIYAPEYDKFVEEKKIKHMPWTQVCDVKTVDGKEVKENCKTIVGYDKKKLEKAILGTKTNTNKQKVKKA